MNQASGAVTPLNPELIQVSDPTGQRAQLRRLAEGSVGTVGVVEVLVLVQHDHQVPLVPVKVRSSDSRRQLPIHRSMIEFVRG
jgi:hypothetical protein